MHSGARDNSRKLFLESWQKHKNQLPIEPLEAQLIETILLHPEYHPILDDEDTALANDFTEHNPFLHMGLHLALREQIATDIPKGIRPIFIALCSKNNDIHAVEHKMMGCLSQSIWDMQHLGKEFDVEGYMESLRQI